MIAALSPPHTFAQIPVLSRWRPRVAAKGREPLHPAHLIRLLVLAACLTPVEALAEADAGKGCAPAPTSPLVVNVRDKGAKGDGKSDDTQAIQDAIDQVAGSGGTVLVPDGVYRVGVEKSDHLKLASGMTFKLSPKAVLKAFPSKSGNYSLLDIAESSNVTVTGGTLEGERFEHKGKSGEGGMGIRILRGAKHITISGVTAKNMWGDGFYVKSASDVKFCAVTAAGNRRQGLSIIDADNILVTNSIFRDTHGTPPAAGIDMEPDRREQTVSGARIVYSQFIGNQGAGIKLHGKRSTVSDLEIHHNVFKGNKPIELKGDYAGLASAICGNRYLAEEDVAGRSEGGLYAYGEPVKMVHQDGGWVVTLNGTGTCGKGSGGNDRATESPLAPH